MNNKISFPSVNMADENGLLAIGGDYSLSTLLAAYYNGIFPWPLGSNIKTITWFAPDPRGAILLDNFKIPKSFKKFLRSKMGNNSNVSQIINFSFVGVKFIIHKLISYKQRTPVRSSLNSTSCI